MPGSYLPMPQGTVVSKEDAQQKLRLFTVAGAAHVRLKPNLGGGFVFPV